MNSSLEIIFMFWNFLIGDIYQRVFNVYLSYEYQIYSTRIKYLPTYSTYYMVKFEFLMEWVVKIKIKDYLKVLKKCEIR